VIAENISLPINENKITTPILIKLLATSNVAEAFLGRSIKSAIILPLTHGLVRSHQCLVATKKKATSAPETNAEQRKTNIPIKPNIRSVSNVYANKLGSGSTLKD
jgi:hypothetical protein